MTLSPDRMLSHYRLIEQIGEGGMGVVWRATDTTLGRSVAIKVLPERVGADPERVARFEREARLLASLNHPRIASIYGFHSAEGLRFLAMELAEGQDLTARIGLGPIPVPEALRVALQLAEGLEVAHDKGIVHRDLKPANIKLGSDGSIKILDFGLAKALEGDPQGPASSVSLSQSPTMASLMTGAHVILGTAAYMSPEQARGQLVDRRADIWAFGVIVFEMLTGQQLFSGETVSDTLAAVLKTEVDWSGLPAATPARIRTLLRRCLDRDPRHRLRDIGEARITLEEVIGGVGGEPAPAPVAARSSKFPGWAAGAVGLIIGGLLAFAAARGTAPKVPEAPHRKFRILSAGEATMRPRTPVLSPDGRRLAYIGGDQVWVQDLESLDAKAVVTAQNLIFVFWSPDGSQLGYAAGTKLYRLPAAGGEPQSIADAGAPLTSGSGATWLESGTVVFSRGDAAGLLEVSSLGGDPKTLVPTDSTETDLHEPHGLPGDRGIVFASHRKRGAFNNLMLWSGGKRTLLIEAKDQVFYSFHYSPTGHIVYQRTPTTPGVWALPFSLQKLERTGEPFLVAAGGGLPSVSREGSLAFLEGGGSQRQQLVWTDRTGKETGTIGPPIEGNGAGRLAPDGVRLAVATKDLDTPDLWIFDSARGTQTRLTFDPGIEEFPAWSPSGDRIVYHARAKECTGAECFTVLALATDGSGARDTLAHGIIPTLTPDRASVLYSDLGSTGAIWQGMKCPSVRGQAAPFIASNHRVLDFEVNPAQSLVAYMSDESGAWEVYLARYPQGTGKWQVSTAGGQWPRWNASGDRLYFVQAEDVMEVDVSGAASPELGMPRKLFTRQASSVWGFGLYRPFDVTRDGARFVIAKPIQETAHREGIVLVQNWMAEFRDRK